LDLEGIRHLAELSRLSLSEEEMEALREHFERIMGYFARLSTLDLEGVEPFYGFGEEATPTREDEVASWPDRDLFLEGLPRREGDFVRVPRIVREV